MCLLSNGSVCPGSCPALFLLARCQKNTSVVSGRTPPQKMPSACRPCPWALILPLPLLRPPTTTPATFLTRPSHPTGKHLFHAAQCCQWRPADLFNVQRVIMVYRHSVSPPPHRTDDEEHLFLRELKERHPLVISVPSQANDNR